MRVRTWDSLPQAEFYIKNRLRVYPFWANLYQKLQISAIFAAVSPHFKSENDEMWRECKDPGHLPALNFVLKNRSGGFVL